MNIFKLFGKKEKFKMHTVVFTSTFMGVKYEQSIMATSKDDAINRLKQFWKEEDTKEIIEVREGL